MSLFDSKVVDQTLCWLLDCQRLKREIFEKSQEKAMGKSRKVTYELRTTSRNNPSSNWSNSLKDKEQFLSWATKSLAVFCNISPEINLLDIAKLWNHTSRAVVVHQNCTAQASGKSANALLRSVFNEIRYALDRGDETLAKSLILSEACFTAYFLNDTKTVVEFLETFDSWPCLTDEDIDKMKQQTSLKNVFHGTNTCESFSQNILATRSRVTMVHYLLLPPWLLQGSVERLHKSLAIVELTLVEKGVGTTRVIRLRSGHTFRTLCILLAHEAQLDNVQSLRVSHHDRPIFLSSCGNKKLDDLNICDGDVLGYVDAQRMSESSQVSAQDSPTNNASAPRTKQRRNTGKKRFKNSSVQLSYQTSTPKEIHSKLLTQLHEEAEPLFRDIRKKLNDLAIKKQPNPKRTKSKVQAQRMDQNNPSDVGIGGAPGNIMFEVVVGNVDDLYKSSKPGSGRNSQVQSKNGTRRRLSIDLHGKSTDEALKSLDDSLPSWLETAMRGSYPFVSAVDIITGGGHQILSEVVEKWIKSQRHVARRPKSFTFA